MGRVLIDNPEYMSGWTTMESLLGQEKECRERRRTWMVVGYILSVRNCAHQIHDYNDFGVATSRLFPTTVLQCHVTRPRVISIWVVVLKPKINLLPWSRVQQNKCLCKSIKGLLVCLESRLQSQWPQWLAIVSNTISTRAFYLGLWPMDD